MGNVRTWQCQETGDTAANISFVVFEVPWIQSIIPKKPPAFWFNVERAICISICSTYPANKNMES